jgi:two-component system cell cycle sensor histidine kinase/response regulator CckA
MAAHSLSTILPHGYEVQEDIKDINDSARRGAELTRQLLTFSRGKPVLPRRIVLNDLVQELTPMLHRIVRADVRIDVQVVSQSLASMADPSQLERVLMNLCQNANDAMPHGGSITIRVGLPGQADAGFTPPALKRGVSYAVLTVSDTGEGMSEQVRSRLFEPFFTTKSGQRGTGLGLANVYAIVQQCGGLIDVASELGQGSTFRIYLPRCESSSEPTPATTRVMASHETVLVVDDDDMLRREVVKVLERAGYRVLSACDAEDALRVVDAHHGLLDLAVTDLRMPGRDGSELAISLLARDPTLKLLFVSGDGPDELQRKGLLTPHSAFLAKPFAPDALLRQIQSVLRATAAVSTLAVMTDQLS